MPPGHRGPAWAEGEVVRESAHSKHTFPLPARPLTLIDSRAGPNGRGRHARSLHAAVSDESIPPAVFSSLQASGFPFQTAIAHVIHAKTPTGWSVHASEYAWLPLAGEGQFLDLVAQKGPLLLTIECKKTAKDVWTFLRPVGLRHSGETAEFHCVQGKQAPSFMTSLVLSCAAWNLEPRSTISEFCVIGTSKTGDQRMLERDAGLLIRGTDAFADDFRGREHLTKEASPFLFVPVIVTNASIYTTRYQPRAVSLKTGQLSALPEETEPADVVRFQKTFVTETRFDVGVRSVFIVRASAFADFLDRLALAQSQPMDRMERPFVRGLRELRA